jgi:uncharacterized protein with ATP-grasp and redox domains
MTHSEQGNGKPAWLMTSEAGSFAEYTIKVRKPEIIDKILADNVYPSGIVEELKRFKQEIAMGTISGLAENTPDQQLWNRQIDFYGQVSWFDLPWYFAESYFYRRVLAITQYYKPASPFFLRDPFRTQKYQQASNDLDGLEQVMDSTQSADSETLLGQYINGALWANRADLSNNSIKMAKEFHSEAAGGDHLFLLIDDTEKLGRYLTAKSKKTAYFVDNVGREFYADLMLIDYLIDHGFADEVVVFVKSAPLFVSDVTQQDVLIAFDFLLQSATETIRQFGVRLQTYLAQGKLRVRVEQLLNLPFMLDEMPTTFLQELGNFDLVIFKGDANYRRVLGDRHWALTASLHEIMPYFPSNLLLIRTLKSELAAGLPPETIDEMESRASDWLINGTCGVIQFVELSEMREYE